MKKAVTFLIVGVLFLVACGGDSDTAGTSSKNTTDSQKKQMSWETEMEADEAIALVKSYINDNCDTNSHYIEYPDFTKVRPQWVDGLYTIATLPRLELMPLVNGRHGNPQKQLRLYGMMIAKKFTRYLSWVIDSPEN